MIELVFAMISLVLFVITLIWMFEIWWVLRSILKCFHESIRRGEQLHASLESIRNGLNVTHQELQEINASTLATYELSKMEARKI